MRNTVVFKKIFCETNMCHGFQNPDLFFFPAAVLLHNNLIIDILQLSRTRLKFKMQTNSFEFGEHKFKIVTVT